MVSVSPRLPDDLEFEDDRELDPRFVLGFRSISLGSEEFEHYEPQDDHRPYSASGDPSASRKKRRQRCSDVVFNHLEPFEYQTVADGDLFRLAVLFPGSGMQPVSCRLIWESSKDPKRDYRCLSYCWQTIDRDADIICDGFRMPVTKNLLSALRSLRDPRANLLIWIDQICINQEDDLERGHQVSIMKKIFNQAKEVIVWLGEEDAQSRKLYEYARKMERGRHSPRNAQKSVMKKLLNPRQLQEAIQALLERPWFQRVWVIPEVALARFTIVVCGRDRISWDNLVRLVRDVDVPQVASFDKHMALPGNPRQRIAIITQMIASQRAGLYHTDITQLLLLAKSSKATDVRDMIFAFYGVTLLTTFPDYTRSVEMLYADIIEMYIISITRETYYSTFHDLTEERLTHQLMSILYSAGSLNQHYSLPSWIPDFTYSWHLAPLWCKTTSNVLTGSGKDEWSVGVRCDYRAGGEKRGEYEIIEGPYGMHKLRISVILFDTVAIVSETAPATTPEQTEDQLETTLRYGRIYFRSAKGYVGIATPGIEAGDDIAIVLGGDVPVVLRRSDNHEEKSRSYKLLCECCVQNDAIMSGKMARMEPTNAEDIVLI